MAALQKLGLVVALAGLAIVTPGGTMPLPIGVLPAVAQAPARGAGEGPGVPPSEPLPLVEAPREDEAAAPARIDTLLSELAEPGRKDWEQLETEILRIWSRSGSPAMDLLLERGQKALAEEDYPTAVEHFSALIDHAPGFAEAWNSRATAYFLEGNFGLAMADVEHVLVLNPRHFGALTGLASMFEAMDEPRDALAALRMAAKLNPNRPGIKDEIARLEKQTGEVEL